MLVGYARTSTIEQAAGLAAQRRDLKAANCEKIFAEQVSSVAARAKLTAALEFVREGDVLVVTKPDRLARSTRNLLDIVEDLEKSGRRPGRAVNGRPADRHPQPDRKADADHVGRHRDLRTRPDARATTRGNRQGRGRGQIQGPCADRSRQDSRRAANGKGGPDTRYDRG